MSWGNGLSSLPDIEGIDIWSDPPEIEEPIGTPRRRMRAPRIERLRPRYEAELGDENEVEIALDQEEERQSRLSSSRPQLRQQLRPETAKGDFLSEADSARSIRDEQRRRQSGGTHGAEIPVVSEFNNCFPSFF